MSRHVEKTVSLGIRIRTLQYLDNLLRRLRRAKRDTNLEGQAESIRMRYKLSNCRKCFNLLLADASSIT